MGGGLQKREREVIMAEYIDREDLRNKIDDWYKLKEPLVPDNLAEGFVQMDILISKQPLADVTERAKIDKAIEKIEQTLYVDSLIFGELIDFKNGKISADDVIEEFNRVTRIEVLKILKEI